MMSRELEGRPYYWVSAYLIEDLLIDSGCAYCAEEFLQFLDANDLRPSAIVNTHHHEDHIGGNRVIQEKFGTAIFAHPEAVPFIQNPPKLPDYRMVAWGNAESAKAEPLPDRIEVSGLVFEFVETPGHCDGHVAVVERNRGWCFSGDLYIAEKLCVAGREFDANLLIESMTKLADLEMDDFTLFTSLRTVKKKGRAALRGAAAHLKDLGRKAIHLRSRGYEINDIVDELFGSESTFNHTTKGHFSSANLIRSLLK